MGAIICHSELKKDLSYEGFNMALTIFKVPLSVLAMIIPTVALFAANHRSEQTKEQMRLANIQNNFANYYKHREEFEKFCEKDTENSKNIIILPLKLHTLIFPDATKGIYSISENFITEIDDFLTEILTNCEEMNQKNFTQEETKLKTQLSGFSLKYYIGSYSSKTNVKRSFSVYCGDVQSFIENLKIVIMVIRDTLRFDPSYEPSELVTQITELNESSIRKNLGGNMNLRALINKGIFSNKD